MKKYNYTSKHNYRQERDELSPALEIDGRCNAQTTVRKPRSSIVNIIQLAKPTLGDELFHNAHKLNIGLSTIEATFPPLACYHLRVGLPGYVILTQLSPSLIRYA
ncbi:hypothetical protein J6590_071619 [Homalodisca vitripennis]|nr:hypothetical protein J6590_071619 [Homalodisca vitripennis]